MKADANEIRDLKKKMSKFVNLKEIEEIKSKLAGKAEKMQIQYLEEQMREERRKWEKAISESIERGEYLGRQIQTTKGGLLECMQALASKVEKEKVDKQERMIKELQKFDPRELKKEVVNKIKENKGKREGLVVIGRIF
jgi:hypothetical protein